MTHVTVASDVTKDNCPFCSLSTVCHYHRETCFMSFNLCIQRTCLFRKVSCAIMCAIYFHSENQSGFSIEIDMEHISIQQPGVRNIFKSLLVSGDVIYFCISWAFWIILMGGKLIRCWFSFCEWFTRHLQVCTKVFNPIWQYIDGHETFAHICTLNPPCLWSGLAECVKGLV